MKAIYIVVAFISMLLISFGTIGSLFILYIKDIYRLETITSIALAFTISSSASIIAIILVGYLYDKYGLSAPMSLALTSMIFWALCMYSMSRFTSWSKASVLWYTGGVFQGLVTASIMIGINPTLMRLFPARRGLAISASQSAQALAMAFWGYIATYLIHLLGFFNALTVMGLMGTSSIALAMAVFNRVAQIPNEYKDNKDSGIPRNSSKNPNGIVIDVKLVLVYTMILFIALSSIVVMNFFAGIIEESFTITLGNVEYIRLEIVPKIMMITGFAQAISAILWGYAIDKLGALKTIPMIYVLETIATTLAYLAYRLNPWIVSGFIILRYMFFSAEPVAHWVLVPSLFGLENLGRISGIINSAPMVASLIAPIIAGIIKDNIGTHSYILLISSLLSVISLSVYINLRRVITSKQ
ncbi:MAG: MFS transporter [Ignisphaera sp.]|uniref:MFS transporter n=1 Tax=Ignisphaera aggregans TaxID=334771 RepID=A0A7C4NK71_9CREN